MKAIVLLVACLFWACSASANEKIYLFGDYFYGMSKEEALKAGALPCQEVNPTVKDGDALCGSRPAILANALWNMIFKFQDGKLAAVVLSGGLRAYTIANMLSFLEENHYLPALLKAGGGSLDMLSVLNDPDSPHSREVIRSFNNFIDDAPDFTVYLVPLADIPPGARVADYASLKELINPNATLLTVDCSKPKNNISLIFQPFLKASPENAD